VSNPYLFWRLGLASERKADAPSCCKQTKTKGSDRGSGDSSAACKAEELYGTYLTGKETEPREIIYFKLYKGQLPVVERALEIAALMLGSDKSRGYSLEMICADFLAGAALETGGSEQNLGCSTSTGGSFAASEQPDSTNCRGHE